MISTLLDSLLSNLPETSPKIFSGIIDNDVEILVSTTPAYQLITEIDGKKYSVDFGYSVSEEDQKYRILYSASTQIS